MATELSPNTLERLVHFQEVFSEFELWRATLPDEEQELLNQHGATVLIMERRPTQPLPVVSVEKPSPIETPLGDTSDPVSDEAVSSAPALPTTTKGRGRPKKTVQ